MIEKFKEDKHFLRQLWLGFISIASLTERERDEPRRLNKGLKLSQLDIKKPLNLSTLKKAEETSCEDQVWRTKDLCQEIKENKEIVKLSVLEHVKKFIDIYYKVTFRIKTYSFQYITFT